MKNSRCLVILSVALLPMTAFPADSFYCPQKQGYVRIGMTDSQVMDTCGPPQMKHDAGNATIIQKVPVTQLIYTTLNQGAVYPGLTSYYQMWSLPSGSAGTSLHVNVIDNKVTGITMNGSGTNAMSVCGGYSVQVGDDVNKVYSACGSPSLVNHTFINQPLTKKQQPEVWIYQVNEYQPAISLTFINGKLQSIQ